MIPKTIDLYVAKQMTLTMMVIAGVLTGLMLMTQSLRFLDLVITAGASGLTFLTLSFLALPRFLEVIIPVALAAAILFTLSRLRADGEFVTMQGAGLSPARLLRPIILTASLWGVFLFFILGWVAPLTLARMQEMRQIIKVQYSTAMFREGVFNAVGPDITVYIAKRLADGGLEGLTIHDARPENTTPYTLTARNGQLVMTDQGQQIIVYQGVRENLNPTTRTLDRLRFDRYVIDLPDSGPLRQRWREPEERTLPHLWRVPDRASLSARQQGEIRAEFYRRLLSPLLVPVWAAIAAIIMILAPFGRHPSSKPVITACLIILLLQSLYIAAFSSAKAGLGGLIAMGGLVILPALMVGWITLVTSRSRTPTPQRSPA